MSPTSEHPNSQPGRMPRHASRSVPLVSGTRQYGGYGKGGVTSGEGAQHLAPIVRREPAHGRVASEDDPYRSERGAGREAQAGRRAEDAAAAGGHEGGRSRHGRAGRAPRVVPRSSAASNPSPVSVAAAWVAGHRVLTGVVVTLAIVVGLLYAPLKAYYVAERTNAILDQRLSAVTSTNEELQGEVDNLMTQEGIEDEARRRGYVKDGDTGVDMAGVDDTGSASTDDTVGQSASTDGSELPWYTDLLDFIFQYDADAQGVSQNG